VRRSGWGAARPLVVALVWAVLLTLLLTPLTLAQDGRYGERLEGQHIVDEPNVIPGGDHPYSFAFNSGWGLGGAALHHYGTWPRMHEADFDMARAITLNGKTQRPGVCNAIENLLVHAGIADAFLPVAGRELAEAGVELRADERAAAILRNSGITAKPATEEDWETEYLDLILSIRVVETPDEAIAFINRYGSHHSDGIITADDPTARRFIAGVDSATVYWNASTRFTDGYEFGLGAEVGISTDRLHARGPMGVRELCTYKYAVFGQGQVRE